MIAALVKDFKLSMEGVPRIIALLTGVKIVLPSTLDLVFLETVDNRRTGFSNAAHLCSFAISLRCSNGAALHPFNGMLSDTGRIVSVCLTKRGREPEFKLCPNHSMNAS